MSNESTEIGKGDSTAGEVEAVSAEEPPAKKKRGASHQITKDDFEDGENDDSENEDKLKQGFKRASDEVISKRKIYKVKRSFATRETTSVDTENGVSATPKPPANEEPTTKSGGDSSNQSGSTMSTANGSSNPFASTILISSSTKKPTEGDRPPKKVFGFGSASGFGAAASGSSTGSGSSGFGGGGGFAGVGNIGKSSGFGSSGIAGTTSGFVFGSSSSTASGGSTKSLFGNAGASGASFSLSKESDTKKDSTSTNTFGSATSTKLPDKVDLKTGEEDEDAIHTGRCRSYVWVVEDDDEKNSDSAGSNDDGDSGKNKANPSVQSSTQFQAAISTASSSNKDKKENGGVKGDKSDSSPAREDGTEATASANKSSDEDVKHRWKKLGVGPVKILRSKSNPGRLRLVQRQESNKGGSASTLILNVPLWKESTCERDKQAQTYLHLKTMKEGEICQYNFQFKESADAGSFHHHLSEHIPRARQCFDETAASTALKTNETTPAKKDD